MQFPLYCGAQRDLGSLTCAAKLTKTDNREKRRRRKRKFRRARVSLFIDGVVEMRGRGRAVIELAFPGFKEKFQWRDRRECSYFTCSARASIPAANGAEAEVPVCLVVQVFFRSVVACKAEMEDIKLFRAPCRFLLSASSLSLSFTLDFRADAKGRR